MKAFKEKFHREELFWEKSYNSERIKAFKKNFAKPKALNNTVLLRY
jgi:hypothetical protein